MKTKLASVIAAALLATGCTSSPYQYKTDQSLAWNTVRAGEISKDDDVLPDNEPTEEMINEGGLLSSAAEAGVYSAGSLGLSFGTHLLFSMNDNYLKYGKAKKSYMITTVSVGDQSDKEVGRFVSDQLSESLKEMYPDTVITDHNDTFSYSAFTASGGACDAMIAYAKLNDWVEEYINKTEERGCRAYVYSSILNVTDAQYFGKESEQLVRIQLGGSFPLTVFTGEKAGLDDMFFYFPPASKGKKGSDIDRPAMVINKQKAHLFIKPVNGNEFVVPAESVYPDFVTNI